MSAATIYETATGRIKRIYDGPFPQLQPRSSEGWVEGRFSGQEYWVDDGVPMLRPTMPVTVTGHSVVVPGFAKFVVRGPATVDGEVGASGEVEFEFDEPGEYTITFRLFPYLDAEVVLHED